MRKSEYIQLVKDGVGTMFKDRTIAIHIGLVFEQVFGQVYASDPQQLDFYTKEYTCSVIDEKPYPYVMLPKKIVHFKDLKKGVRSVCYPHDTEIRFVPVSGVGQKVYAKLTGGIDKSIGFEVKTNKVFLERKPDGDELTLSLVIPFQEWDMEDDIPAPSGMAENIIQMAISSVKGEGIPQNIHKK